MDELAKQALVRAYTSEQIKDALHDFAASSQSQPHRNIAYLALELIEVAEKFDVDCDCGKDGCGLPDRIGGLTLAAVALTRTHHPLTSTLAAMVGGEAASKIAVEITEQLGKLPHLTQAAGQA